MSCRCPYCGHGEDAPTRSVDPQWQALRQRAQRSDLASIPVQARVVAALVDAAVEGIEARARLDRLRRSM